VSSYDQFFKKLFETFFADLLRLVAPELLARFPLERVQFRDKQSFTDWPEGNRREMDLLAQVERSRKPAVLVHVEIEARARRTMDQRLWQYYMQIRLREGLQVIPILVNIRGGPAGVTRQTSVEGADGEETARFQHRCFGVGGCLAEEYLAKPEPLAWGLAALMQSRRWNRVEQKLECLRRIAAAPGLSEIQTHLLVDCVERYLELTRDEAAAFATLATPAAKEVSAMQLTWSERIRREGLLEGRKEGRQEGRQEGLAAAVRSLKNIVFRLLSQRFGSVPAKVRRRIEAIDAVEPLERIAGEVLTAPSLDAVKLD
jgi:hypothetical protein